MTSFSNKKINGSIYLSYVYKKWLCKKYKKNTKHYADELLEAVNVLSVTEKTKYFVLIFVFNCLKGKFQMDYFKNLFVIKNTGRTRSATKNTLEHNYTSKQKIFENSIQFRAVTEWNSLPKEVSDLDCSLSIFKTRLCKYLLKIRLNDASNIYNPP